MLSFNPSSDETPRRKCHRKLRAGVDFGRDHHYFVMCMVASLSLAFTKGKTKRATWISDSKSGACSTVSCLCVNLGTLLLLSGLPVTLMSHREFAGRNPLEDAK